MLYIMAFLFGLGDAIGTVTPPLITSAIFGAEKYGEAYGIANSFTQIGLSLGALMVAAVYDTSGSYNTAWILLIILTLGAFAGWVGAYAVSRKYCQNQWRTIRKMHRPPNKPGRQWLRCADCLGGWVALSLKSRISRRAAAQWHACPQPGRN